MVPSDDVKSPEVTILIPALNEELTIGDFVDWCHEGCARPASWARSSSSTARPTAPPRSRWPAARACCKTPKRGLGRAYIDALPYIRGTYVIMGDADCTYDFRELGAVRRGDARTAPSS